MRETLFNWLQRDIAGAHCLDLFAGSGVLGLEALSRGAASLCAVEQDRAAARRLRENVVLLGEQGAAEVLETDALRLLLSPPQRPFDIVFADPPFADGVLPRVCRLLEENRWLAADAALYLEQDAHQPWPLVPVNWAVSRSGRAGQSGHRLLRRNTPG